MKEYFIFYILLAVLIVLLIFVVLLYSDYHSRTIIPSLLSTNYPVDAITSDYNSLYLNLDTASTNGSILFGNGAVDSKATVSFIPIAGDETRVMSGAIILLMGSNTTPNSIYLRIKDQADGNIIGDESQFFLPVVDEWGLTVIRMNFKTDQTDTLHDIIVEAKTVDGGNIASGGILVNSGYVVYY